MARLAHLVGEAQVGSPRVLDNHRPDGFQMSRFHPPREAPEIGDNNGDAGGESEPLTAFRVFRPAPRAQVAVREGRPAHISFFQTRGDVIAASGPWRTSGEWWREDAWNREEWEIEVRRADKRAVANELSSLADPQTSVYRIYYDALCRAWFVAGMYD